MIQSVGRRREQDYTGNVGHQIHGGTFKNAVTGVNNIVNTLVVKKAKTRQRTTQKNSKNYFTHGRIMFWILNYASSWWQWRSQPKNFGGAKMFDYRRITLSCLEKRLSKHKITIYSKNFGGSMAPLAPTVYAYGWWYRLSSLLSRDWKLGCSAKVTLFMTYHTSRYINTIVCACQVLVQWEWLIFCHYLWNTCYHGFAVFSMAT